MSGKTLVWLVMLAGLASAWFAASHPDLVRGSTNWFQAHMTGTDPTYSERQFEQDLVDRMNFCRRNAKLPQLVVDGELQTWLKKSSDQISSNDLDATIKTVLNGQPRYYQVNVSSAHDTRLLALTDKFDEIASQSSAASHHMAILTRPQSKGYGYEAVVIIGQRLDNFSPEAMTAKTTDIFFSICPHCKTPHACKVSLAQRGVNLDCPKCGLDYGVVAPDERGRFRYANEYLTGYQPPTCYAADSSKLHEMFTIWSAVVSSYVYTKDAMPGSPNRDCWQTPLETMVRAKGDCEDSSILLADWLISRGFEARVALGRYGDIGQHAWCVVRIDNVDYLLESTEGPPKMEKLPFVQVVGDRYLPETMFDRDNIYVRAKPHDRFDGNYWSNKTWIKVRPRQLFDEPAPKRPLLAAQEVESQTATTTPSAPRPVMTGSRTKRPEAHAGIPTPSFMHLKEIPSGTQKWQFTTPLLK